MDGLYSTLDDAMAAIEQIKKKFVQSGPQFDGAKQIMADICSRQIDEVAMTVSIAGRQELNLNYRKAQEKVLHLEECLRQQKAESVLASETFKFKLSSLESEKNECLKQQKLSEDRLHFMQRDLESSIHKHQL